MAAALELKRELVAILAGEVAGYHRLLSENRELAMRNRAAYRDLVADVVEDQRGRPLDGDGDRLVYLFDSVLAALRCAVEVQQLLHDVNDGVPAERQMALRFGLHLVDAVVDRGDRDLGDGPAIAGRLEALAEPGGIWVSDAVYGNLAEGPEFAFEALGRTPLPGIPRPIEAYRLRLDGPWQAGAAQAAEERPPAEDAEAVAVLPFESLSGEAEDDELADGFTDELVTALAAWRAFPIIARNSTFAYKGKSPDVRTIARDLGARYVLQGRIGGGARRLRLEVALTDGARGRRLWTERFDREASAVFALRDEVARQVAAALAPGVGPASAGPSDAERPRDLAAWRLCQRGRAFLDAFTPEGNARARALFEQAIALDPGDSQPYVGLAYSHHRDLWFEVAPSRDQAIKALLAAARTALTLDWSSSEAHCILGFGLIWDRQFHLAIDAGEEAVRLNPSNAIAFSQLGVALSFAGRPLDGIASLERSLRLNPQDPRMHFVLAMLARAQLNARAPERAAYWAQIAIHRRPGYPLSHLVRASALGHLGRIEEARAALAACERLEAGFATRWALRPMYKNPNDDLYFLDGLRQAGLEA